MAAYANSLLGLLLPFLNRSLFLWLMGPQYLGLNGLFGSILGMLSLAELGFGAAVVYSMYKPIAEDNKPLVCAYLRFYRTVYRCVGAVIFLAGLCLMPFLRRLIHGAIPPELNLHLLFFIHVLVVLHAIPDGGHLHVLPEVALYSLAHWVVVVDLVRPVGEVLVNLLLRPTTAA